jgi:hypothetical protein
VRGIIERCLAYGPPRKGPNRAKGDSARAQKLQRDAVWVL